jgi:hypothetical protein
MRTLDKLLMVVAPAGITFGPLFMTNNAGEAIKDVRFIGVAMLAIALVWMYRMILAQQRQIETLQQQVTPALQPSISS